MSKRTTVRPCRQCGILIEFASETPGEKPIAVQRVRAVYRKRNLGIGFDDPTLEALRAGDFFTGSGGAFYVAHRDTCSRMKSAAKL